MEGLQAGQLAAVDAVAGPSTFLAPAIPQAHGATVNQGDLSVAGRDVHVHKHYHSYPDRVDILAVLGAIRNLRTIHLGIVSKATPGTGVWLLKTEKFLMWVDLNGNLKILWGTGIPGAGKTVLASIVIRELEARAKAAGGQICICYVYIRYSDCADLTVRNVLETFVKQTVERHPGCKILAEQAYTQHLHEKTQPTEDELLELLGQFAEATAATFYLLDALDEAPNRIQIDLVQKLASLNVRLFITSRPLKAVEAQAPNAHCFTIVAQDSDLDLHIAQKIARSRDLQGLLEEVGSSLRNEIVSQVKSKCNGMFLHASLQLDALCQCVSTREVRQTLEAFPSNIEEVYRQTWCRILEQKPSHVIIAKSMLLWVLNASRSMTIEELERAIATSPETYKFEQDRRVPGTTLITLCCGLVILEEEGRRVRLVHYTAKDILQGLLHDSFPHPHSYLATVCMTHLTKCGFQNTTIRSGEEFTAARRLDPLLAYASDAWATHARESLNVADTRQRTTNFVRESSAYPILIEPGVPESFDILGPFHILAIYNLPLSLVAQGGIGDPNVTTQIYQGSPLGLASWRGHKEAVLHLLAHPDIQVNLVNDKGWSTLMVVAVAGHEGIVKLLLARPEIQVNMFGINGSSALIYAAKNGHGGIVKLLLAHPEIQINLVKKDGRSALMMAAEHGHETSVKLLLAHPEIQINLVKKDGRSALMMAAEHGHETSVKLLLAHPEIQINLVDNDGWSALMVAARYGHESIVELLLAHPETQINLVKNDGCSALMSAATDGHEGIVKLLLAHPEAQINLVDTIEWSALMRAAFHGRESIVKLLLTYPEVQINLVDNDGKSALILAALSGHKTVVELLLTTGALHVNVFDNDGNTAIKTAAGQGHAAVVRLLLSVPGVDITIKSITDGHTAMTVAQASGHDDVVALLLEFEPRNAVIARAPVISPPFVHSSPGEDGSDSDSSEAYFDAEEQSAEDVDEDSQVSVT